MAGFYIMKVTLAIDTSTARTQFAVLLGNELKWLEIEDGATTHGDVLAKFGELAAREKIDQVIVGMGPGPFTGLRTGIIFAKSFAFARGLPIHGICSLDAIAFDINLPEFIIATDARRKEIYWAKYVDGKRVSGPHVGRPSEIAEYAERKFGFGFTSTLFPSPLHLLHANDEIMQPLYLRKPDAQPQITYREMNHFDLGAVHAMERESYEHDPWTLNQFKEELSEVPRSRHYVVACEGDRIVGYAGIAITLDVADIHTITVDNAFRRRGIGKSLLSQIESWAVSRGAKQLMLEMRVGNTQAQPLYEKFGYSVISLRKNYYGKGVDALVMGKSIS